MSYDIHDNALQEDQPAQTICSMASLRAIATSTLPDEASGLLSLLPLEYHARNLASVQQARAVVRDPHAQGCRSPEAIVIRHPNLVGSEGN